jgi:hypothetical protein
VAIAYSILGQSVATSLTAVYTVPSATEATSFFTVGNNDTVARTFQLKIAPLGAADNSVHFIADDVSIPAKESFIFPYPFYLSPTDVIRYLGETALVSLNIHGAEINPVQSGVNRGILAQAAPTATRSTLYTCPSSTQTIAYLSVSNTGTAGTISLAAAPGGAAHVAQHVLFEDLDVGAQDTYLHPVPIFLEATDVLRIEGESDNRYKFTLTGLELT